MSAITIRSRRSSFQPENWGDHIRLQGEAIWYIEGPTEIIRQAAIALSGLCESITDQVLLVNFGNAVGWFRVPGIGQIEVVSGKWEERHFDRMLVDLSVWAAALPFSTEGGAVASERSATDQLPVLYHAFAYLRAVLSDHVAPERRMLDTLGLVLRDPHRQLLRVRRRVP